MVINISIRNKIPHFNLEPKVGPQKYSVYLKLFWIGKIFLKFETQIKSAVQKCYGAVDPCVTFSTRKLLPAIHKDALPSTHQSMVVYQYVCRCDCRYLGRTSQRMYGKIAEHIPNSIRNKSILFITILTRNCKTKISTIQNQVLQLDFTYYKLRQILQRSTIFDVSKCTKSILPCLLRSHVHFINRYYFVIKNLYSQFKFHINHVIT